ncbi:MAG: hypothetical protein KKD59_06335, partial [Acidobacteria bacterium]|nr:hypothetical protein [Acidobacteriota bacterium]
MGGEIENVRAVFEGMLGAVSVMEVPVHDEDFSAAADAQKMFGGDGDVVEETESHGACGFDTALLAAGGAIEAADAVMLGDIESAFALIRPPGHHSEA